MNSTLDELYLKLNQGPAFLLLGQDYLRLESSTDPFLSEVLRKFGKLSTDAPHYGQIFEGEAQNAVEPALSWMQQRCELFSLPEWLKIVASFSWSGVYTSAIDAIWSRAFRSEWRDLQRIFEEKIRFSDPRNRSRLHCTFLFGCVDKTEEAERSPLTEFELDEREPIAVSLARRLPELITPFGVLLIEGYAGVRDWLSPKNLFQVINELNPGQAYIFSATDELTKDRYISELVKRGKLVLHSEGLASYFVRSQEAGFLKLGKLPEEEEYGRRIQVEGTVLTVPSYIWNQASGSATILDDSIFLIQKISNQRRYSEFGNFLAESSIRPVWSGYEREFAYHREFEDKLRAEVDKQLKSNELKGEPIILHGQTGTGKTTALGALAYSIRKERKHPVLFIERKSQKPSSSDIDAFCQWAEQHGSPTTLIVWDGMVEHEQYYTLLRNLEGRGRKIVLVGSCYRIDPEEIAQNKRRSFVEAPPCLSSNEIPKFIQFINGFAPSLGQSPQRWIEEGNNRFLVALYRLLFPSRSPIRIGVNHELGFYEREIVNKSQEESPKPKTTFGQAFLKAGLITQDHLLSSETQEIGGEEVNQLQKLIGLVMVPGRFGINIPLELLMRAIGKEGITNFVALLKKINTDIIQWHEEVNGNITVGPRHSLEAQLITQARLGTAKIEVAFAKELLIEIRDTNNFFDNPEVQFAVEFVRRIGPNGSDAKYFTDYFLDLSETLGKLREERGVKNPRLMLQEATLLRESVREKSQSGTPPENTEELLDKAEIILNDALELLEDERKNNKQQSFFLTELASVVGTKFQHILKENPESSIQLFNKVRNLAFKAWALDSENYRPIDVLSWTTEALLGRPDILDAKSRAEAEADILHAFTMAEAEDFDAVQLNKRRMTIGKLIGNQRLSEEAFETLLTLGSSAGYYLRANDIVKNLFKDLWPFETELTSDQRDTCQAAAEYLEKNRQAISQDGRSLYLLLRLWWMWKTTKPIFYGERQTLPFTKEDWQYCLRLVEELMFTDTLYNKPLLTYLRGLATFHLDHVQNALDIFKELERESDKTGRRRIIRSYLASTPDGQPQKYSGEVAWRSEDPFKVSGVEVTQLRHRIHFIPQDFNRQNIRRGESLDEFHIAFNFLGLIADPIGYFKFSRKGKL